MRISTAVGVAILGISAAALAQTTTHRPGQRGNSTAMNQTMGNTMIMPNSTMPNTTMPSDPTIPNPITPNNTTEPGMPNTIAPPVG